MKHVPAEIITIGDEILYGQTLDTNAHRISGILDENGIRVVRRTTCGDNEHDILSALAEAENRAGLILITGGLGPTSDDITKTCLARYFEIEIKPNEQALRELEQFMHSMGRELNELTRQQASLPDKCDHIPNDRGTAAGMWFDKNGKIFIAMPGVPHEMKHMMTHHVLPRLRETFELPVIYHKFVRLTGIGESWLAEKIEAWEKRLPDHVKLAYLPTYGDIKMRLTAHGKDVKILEKQVKGLIDSLLPLIDKYVYGFDDNPLEVVIGNILKERNEKLAIAESCTGGYIAHKITSVAGSSDYFNGAVIPYQNEMKVKLLGVKRSTLENHGAVSEETVREMAVGVKERLGADWGLASSGIAGPGGGTPDKPVGTIWVACTGSSGTRTKKLQLTKDRDINIRRSAVAALFMLYQTLIKNN